MRGDLLDITMIVDLPQTTKLLIFGCNILLSLGSVGHGLYFSDISNLIGALAQVCVGGFMSWVTRSVQDWRDKWILLLFSGLAGALKEVQS